MPSKWSCLSTCCEWISYIFAEHIVLWMLFHYVSLSTFHTLISLDITTRHWGVVCWIQIIVILIHLTSQWLTLAWVVRVVLTASSVVDSSTVWQVPFCDARIVICKDITQQLPTQASTEHPLPVEQAFESQCQQADDNEWPPFDIIPYHFIIFPYYVFSFDTCLTMLPHFHCWHPDAWLSNRPLMSGQLVNRKFYLFLTWRWRMTLLLSSYPSAQCCSFSSNRAG